MGVGRLRHQPAKMLYLKIMMGLCLIKFVFSDSDSDSEPRYLDRFSLKFGGKPKRQSQDDLEVSSIIGDLLREQQNGRFDDPRFDETQFAEDRTFPGEDLVRKGAKNLSDDIHALLSDILDGAEEEERKQQNINSLRQELSEEEKRILKSLRDIEEEEQWEQERKPIRFRDSQESTSSIFSSSFGEQGLRSQAERGNRDNVPNLDNKGRFNPSKPKPKPIPSGNSRTRGSRQQASGK